MTIFDQMAARIFNDPNIGEDATYRTAAGVETPGIRVVIEHDVDLVSLGESDIADRRSVVGLLKTDVANPARGDTVITAARAYALDKVLSDDGIETRMIAKPYQAAITDPLDAAAITDPSTGRVITEK